jgi:hypothetical protein
VLQGMRDSSLVSVCLSASLAPAGISVGDDNDDVVDDNDDVDDGTGWHGITRARCLEAVVGGSMHSSFSTTRRSCVLCTCGCAGGSLPNNATQSRINTD